MTERVAKVNHVLQKELGAILLKEFDAPENTLVTLTRADASPNLQQARIYISVMPEEKVPEVFKALQKQVYGIQQMLNKRLKMRPVPRIEWVLEEKTREAQEIEQILEDIKRKK
ncbi:MAG: 30S ribosome-binding factor RbfA [bacterium]|nr:30S ribosome-binding factor RbfA [bacterium]